MLISTGRAHVVSQSLGWTAVVLFPIVWWWKDRRKRLFTKRGKNFFAPYVRSIANTSLNQTSRLRHWFLRCGLHQLKITFTELVIWFRIFQFLHFCPFILVALHVDRQGVLTGCHGCSALWNGWTRFNLNNTSCNYRDVPDFGSGSSRSGIRPFLANPAKSSYGQILWPDLAVFGVAVPSVNNI